MDYAKYVANLLLETEFIIDKNFPLIVHHPFIQDNPFIDLDKNGKLISYDLNNSKNLEKVKLIIKNRIQDAKYIYNLFYLMNKPYRLFYFYLIKDKLSERDFNEYLKEIWITTEFPNADKNVSVNNLLDTFMKINPNLIMNKSELNKYNSLPNKITIYRGTHNKNNYKALSWTLDYEQALWFANRFDKDGYVLEAKVNKSDIIAFFNERNENEVIVNFKNIKHFKVLEKNINLNI